MSRRPPRPPEPRAAQDRRSPRRHHGSAPASRRTTSDAADRADRVGRTATAGTTQRRAAAGRHADARRTDARRTDARRTDARHERRGEAPLARRQPAAERVEVEVRPVRPRTGAAGGRRVPPTDHRGLQKRSPRVPRVVKHRFRAGQSRRRFLAMFVLTSIVFAIVVGRVVWLQTRDSKMLRDAGAAQRTSQTTLRASRGVIFDRNGDELALSVPAVTVIANPKLISDPQGTVTALAGLLTLTAEKQASLLQAFTEKTKGFVYVARQIDPNEAQAVAALDLHGIDTIAEDRRTMPGGDVGKSVIGKTDIDGVGTAGIEKQYDVLLTGVDGEEIREEDRAGRSLPGSGTTTVAPIDGGDVVLTIDRSVQYAVEQALRDQVELLGARGGTAAVLDTKTGEVIAMVGVRRNDEGVVEITSGNIAAVEAAEPGSVVKAITVAAALNEGTVSPDSMFDVPYAAKFSDTTLHDAEPHPDEYWPVSQILTKSSNIGTIKVMLTLADNMRDRKSTLGTYFRAVGFGEKSALDFPGESTGLGADWTKWEGSEQYTVAYGQGIASTTIQLAAAINTIANDGVFVAPKLVKATIDKSGALTETAASESHLVFRPEVADQVNLIMRNVVCNGTAKLAQIDGVTVAGKTGTGLKAQEGGGYTDADGNRKYYSSFAGYFPAEDPQVTVVVSIDEPPGANDEQTRFGGTAAAPVFAKVAPTIMHELDIVPPAGGGCPKV